MTIKRIQAGDRMSQAVVHNTIVYTAGQVALGDSVFGMHGYQRAMHLQELVLKRNWHAKRYWLKYR